ncbi:MAG: sulfite exporter TauE/SafE family protein [Rhodospirillaceae bacterium]
MPDVTSLLLLALALLAAGLAAGLIAGLLGVGGGIVIVPVLFTVFTMFGIDPAITMHLAVGTSLSSIVPTSISSVRSHFRRDAVDVVLLRRWAPGVVVGVIIGTVLAAGVKGPVLTGVFGTVALLAALYMTVVRNEAKLRDTLPGPAIQSVLAALIGGFSSMMGIGGGTLTVPSLVLCNYPIRRAVGTSSAIGMIIAIPGTLGFMIAGSGVSGRPLFSVGYVSLLGLMLTAPVAMLSAPLGARLAHAIEPNWLRRAFALFLALTGCRMLYSLLS